MQETTNLKLKKPDAGDPVKISDLNTNADILDNAITDKAVDTAVVHLDGAEEISGVKTFMGGLQAVDVTAEELTSGQAVAPAPQILSVVKQGLDDKLNTTGGTLTGDLTVGSAKLQTNGYVLSTWLQTTSASNLPNATQIAVLSGGWIYYMTLDQLKEKVGGGGDITVVDTWI